MAEKRNIFLIGPMGAGKSTIGKQLARRLNMDFYDSDDEIEKSTGANISWVFDVEGEKKFRIREEKVINTLVKKQGIVLATGGGSILSKKVRNKLSSRGIVVYLKTSIEKQIIRTSRDKNRPLLNTKDPNELIFKKLENIRNPLYEEIEDIVIYTEDKGIKTLVLEIIRYIDNLV
ncbi:shikimate kinase AroK [Buchnera aphidicola]|uniref:Shikimate kinase 1 n=1 Tax=Buchnera aphidicola (Anoecia oenotherae) TaxID=1241833 RepID=A0A4D6XRQ3_9GAMM|nr:shikimate kinase AroK [Buchnera aphidicola]QCI19536.1 shikimate kinase AroK [Buchnera aphidicola (Anoecia oenotherae)]